MPETVEEAREELSKKIDRLFQNKDADAKQRCRITQVLIDEYKQKAGEYPPPRLLERLASYILKADKLNKFRRRHKTDYQVLSKRQLKIRKSREIHLEDLNSRDRQKINIQITRIGKEKYYQDSF
jgi:hypothetical protein